jgi:anti-anti-sigma factor
MVPVGSSLLDVSSCQLSRPGAEAHPTVVWLRGEHDLSTMEALCLTIAQAIAHDDGTLVIDLSEVHLMSAETVGVLVRTRDYLRVRSRSLTLRRPSMCVRQVFETCGLPDLLDVEPAEETGATQSAVALASWVAVPPAPRVEGHMDRPLPTPSLTPEPVSDRHESSKQREKSVVRPEGP